MGSRAERIRRQPLSGYQLQQQRRRLQQRRWRRQAGVREKIPEVELTEQKLERPECEATKETEQLQEIGLQGVGLVTVEQAVGLDRVDLGKLQEGILCLQQGRVELEQFRALCKVHCHRLRPVIRRLPAGSGAARGRRSASERNHRRCDGRESIPSGRKPTKLGTRPVDGHHHLPRQRRLRLWGR